MTSDKVLRIVNNGLITRKEALKEEANDYADSKSERVQKRWDVAIFLL